MSKKKVLKKTAKKGSVKKVSKKKALTSTASTKTPTQAPTSTAGIGHNNPPAEKKKAKSKTKKGGSTGAAVRKYVKMIETLAEEASDIAADKSEVFKAAKEAGLDTKALRKLISQRRQDRLEMEELQETIDLYEHALEG